MDSARNKGPKNLKSFIHTNDASCNLICTVKNMLQACGTMLPGVLCFSLELEPKLNLGVCVCVLLSASPIRRRDRDNNRTNNNLHLILIIIILINRYDLML